LIRALVFDFDGLIIDTEVGIYRAWQELYRCHGHELTLDVWQQTIGTTEVDFDPMEDLDQRTGWTLNKSAALAWQSQRQRELVEAEPIRPGVAELLQAASVRQLKIGLASSSPNGWVAGHLERTGLIRYFDCIRASDDVAHTKPDPELYLSTLSCLGVPPAEAVAFEDSPAGILAARRAGMRCVAVPGGLTRHLDLAEASLRLESLDQVGLEELWHALESR
jgi:HAD superfamily hydrolase (TIGR01509 family)